MTTTIGTAHPNWQILHTKIKIGKVIPTHGTRGGAVG